MKQEFTEYIIIFLCALGLYANTLGHKYALDDAIVITDNKFTQKGFSGVGDILTNDSFTGFFGEEKALVAGGRYRPLSIVTFAIENAVFGNTPFISHLLNVLLYGLSCVIILKVLKVVFEEYSSGLGKYLPLAVTLFYTFHPIHTDVVANIKGRDEILSMLGALSCLSFAMKYMKKGGIANLIVLAISMFIGILSKENAVTFLAIIPVFIIFFCRNNWKRFIAVVLSIALPVGVFLMVRSAVLPGAQVAEHEITEILNNPFYGASISDKYATIFYTWAIYLKLLFYPHPLTYDYYPYHIKITDWSNSVSVFALVLYLVLFLYTVATVFYIGILKILNKPAPLGMKVTSFGLLVFFASFSVVSNLLFPIGAFMAERFMYMPSLGFAILIGWLFFKLLSILNHKLSVSVSILLVSFVALGFSYKTVSRNRAWYDDYTLFTTDVETSFGSAKGTCSAGGKIIEKATELPVGKKRTDMLLKAKYYLNQSVRVHPKYVEALNLSGNCSFHLAQYDSAIYYYKKVIDIAPSYQNAYTNMLATVEKIENKDSVYNILEYFYKKNSSNYTINYKMGHILGRYKNNLNGAIFYLERAVKIDKTKPAAFKDLGVAYGFSQRFEDAIAMFKRAYELDPDDEQIAINIATTYQNIGKHEDALRIFEEVYKKNQSNNQVLMRMAISLQKLGRNSEALALYNKAQGK